MVRELLSLRWGQQYGLSRVVRETADESVVENLVGVTG